MNINFQILFLFIGIFLLTASIEPARAFEVNIGQDNFVDNTINRVNFDLMSQEPWLCLLNDNLCNNIVKNPNEAGSQNGNIFNIIDDIVENHAADVNIRIFKLNIAKDTKNAEFVTKEGEHLRDELSKIHKSREILYNYLKAGTISHEAYTAALTQNERMEKNILKQVTEKASIIRQTNVELSNEFEKISEDKDIRPNEDPFEVTAKAIHTPKATGTPRVTETPQPAHTPEVTNTPEVTHSPEATNTPEVTHTQEPTHTPKPTHKPEPSHTPEKNLGSVEGN